MATFWINQLCFIKKRFVSYLKKYIYITINFILVYTRLAYVENYMAIFKEIGQRVFGTCPSQRY